MIKNLVISGGGVKIISALGVIKYLEEINQLKHIEMYMGTSAGSILCLMLVLGFNSDEMIKFISDFDLNKIFVVNTDDLFINYHVCSNVKLEKVLKLFINFKLGKPYLSGELDSETISQCSLETNYKDITMEELFKLTGKTLSVTSVCLEKRSPVYITHKNFPSMPVWKAVLASCSIPLIFKSIEWDKLHYVDGALVDNFPLLVINPDEIKYTLGIQFYVDLETNFISHDNPEFNIYDYIFNILKIVMESKTQIKSHNVISVKIDPATLNNFLDITINKETKNLIISQGYTQAKTQFNKLSFKFKTNLPKHNTKIRSNSI